MKSVFASVCVVVLSLQPVWAAVIPPNEGQYETGYDSCGAVLKFNKKNLLQIELKLTLNPRGGQCTRIGREVTATCPDERLVNCTLSTDAFVPGRNDCEAIFLEKDEGFMIFCPDRADGTDALNIPFDYSVQKK
jgi:hypothetical protein